MPWNSYILRDILKRRKDIEKIVPDRDYKLVTIRLYHKGVTLRSMVKGTQIKSTMSSIKAGDFILSGIDARNGAFGIVSKELDGAVVTNDFWCLEPDEKIINKEFLLYLSSTDFFDHICKQSSDGTTQRIRLQKDKFFNYQISLPAIVEQQEILQKLNLQKNLSEVLHSKLLQQMEFVKQLRQAFLREAMQGKLVPQDIREGNGTDLLTKIGAEKTKLKKTKELPAINEKDVPFSIPSNWVWCRLGDICAQISDIDHNMPTAVESGGVKFLSAKDLLDDGTINFTRNIKYISEKDFEKLGRKIIPRRGDIIYSRIGAKLGKARIVTSDEKFLVSYSCCTIRTLNPSVEFLATALDSGFVLKQATESTTDHSIPDLGLQKIKQFLIPLPPLKEQLRIVKELEKIRTLCEGIERSIEESIQQNEMLMRQILKEALQPKVRELGKILAFQARKCSSPDKAILAGRIIKLTNNEDFGRVKFQKLLYLTEHVCKLDLDSHYLQKVAGPHDGKLINEIESTLKRFQFYEIKKQQSKVYYKPLPYVSELDSQFESNFSKEAKSIDGLLSKFKKSTWEQCEIVATLYAAWNNRIIKSEPITDELLKEDFLNWDDQKKKYIDRLDGALKWMREKNVIPDGYGKVIEKEVAE